MDDAAYEEYLNKVQKSRGRDPRLDSDYSWPDAYKDNYVPEAGHGTDKYKLPSHPTFSTDSMYNGKDGNEGGQWNKNDANIWSFTPGKTNLQNHSPEDLQKYFGTHEPDSTLILPM